MDFQWRSFFVLKNKILKNEINLNLLPDPSDYIGEGDEGMDFENIYRKYANDVYSFLKYNIRDQYLVEDILQETFIAVHGSLETLRDEDHLKPWILRIARNKMVDILRKGKKASMNEIVDGGQTEEVASLDDTNISTEELLAQLEEESRTIIYGLYVEGLSYKELSYILNIPEGTVKSKCYYARKKLRKYLEKGGADNGRI